MTSLEQCHVFLRQYLRIKNTEPWVAGYAENRARACLQALNGMAGSWDTSYPDTTYYYPVLVNGALVDLSTLDKVRAFYKYDYSAT